MDLTNLYIVACQDRKAIVVHIASIANTRMSLSHSRHLQCYFKMRYIHGALRSGYATMRNAQCNNLQDNLFLSRCILFEHSRDTSNPCGFVVGSINRKHLPEWAVPWMSYT